MHRDQACSVRGRSFPRALGLTALVLILGMGGSAANAAAVLFSFEGHITGASVGNGFGLAVGDVVTMSGSYDDSFYNGVGTGEVPFGLGNGNLLTLTLGSIVLLESNDIDYLDGTYPTLTLQDGVLVDTNIVMVLGTNGSPVDFTSLDLFFSGSDGNGGFISGNWGVVPEPSSVAMLGIGLAGIAALGRRRPRG